MLFPNGSSACNIHSGETPGELHAYVPRMTARCAAHGYNVRYWRGLVFIGGLANSPSLDRAAFTSLYLTAKGSTRRGEARLALCYSRSMEFVECLASELRS